MRIKFGPNANPDAVPLYARTVITQILDTVGIESVLITSTARDAASQARAMFVNCESQGVAAQKKLYASNGDLVVDVYAVLKKQGKSAAEIQKAMADKIIALGPGNVSHHCADPKELCVVDIAPSSIPEAKHTAFVAAVRSDHRVSKLFTPPQDPAMHLEISLKKA